MAERLVKSSKVSRWGNSAAVRIGTVSLEQANMRIDDPIDITARDGEIVIRRQRPRVTMESLLAGFDPERHRHDLQLDGDAVGKETR